MSNLHDFNHLCQSIKSREKFDSYIISKEKKMGCCQTKMSEEQLADLASKTKFTKSEIEEWHSAFQESCPTGKITKSAFASVYDQFFTKGNATDFAGYVC